MIHESIIIAEAGFSEVVEISKLIASTGTVGVLVWVLHWLFTKELPRRDSAAAEMHKDYKAQIATMQEDRTRSVESYAMELQRIRESDMAERRAERAMTQQLLQSQMKATNELANHVRTVCRYGPENCRGEPAPPGTVAPATSRSDRDGR